MLSAFLLAIGMLWIFRSKTNKKQKKWIGTAVGLEPATSRLRARCLIHCTTGPLQSTSIQLQNTSIRPHDATVPPQYVSVPPQGNTTHRKGRHTASFGYWFMNYRWTLWLRHTWMIVHLSLLTNTMKCLKVQFTTNTASLLLKCTYVWLQWWC